MNDVYDIYDRISKRCLTVSASGTIMLINGLFHTDYPLDSEITYNWTEHVDDELRRTLADTIITIGRGRSYHIEFQMYPDSKIVMRVFEYGYRHADRTRGAGERLYFPKPMVVYLYEGEKGPDTLELIIDFGEQGEFLYRVPVFRYLEADYEEMRKKQLIVLIPFQLLRLRKEIEKKRTPENLEALKALVKNDIIGAIEQNVAAGNISATEGQTLRELSLRLYHHVYRRYEEMESEGVNQAVEDALILDIDIALAEERKKWKAVVAKKEAEMEEKDLKIAEKDSIIEKLQARLQELETGMK